jgi:hypothetical protein
VKYGVLLNESISKKKGSPFHLVTQQGVATQIFTRRALAAVRIFTSCAGLQDNIHGNGGPWFHEQSPL